MFAFFFYGATRYRFFKSAHPPGIKPEPFIWGRVGGQRVLIGSEDPRRLPSRREPGDRPPRPVTRAGKRLWAGRPGVCTASWERFLQTGHLSPCAEPLMNAVSPRHRLWHGGESDSTTGQETAISGGEPEAGWGLTRRFSECGLQTPTRLPLGESVNFKLRSWWY